MAVRTLAREVVVRPRVAPLAIRQPGMAEIDIAEVAGIPMAGAATALVMVGGRSMAGAAIRATDKTVVEAGIAEVAGIPVAGAACSLVVVGRRGMTRNAVSLPDRGVIEDDD